MWTVRIRPSGVVVYSFKMGINLKQKLVNPSAEKVPIGENLLLGNVQEMTETSTAVLQKTLHQHFPRDLFLVSQYNPAPRFQTIHSATVDEHLGCRYRSPRHMVSDHLECISNNRDGFLIFVCFMTEVLLQLDDQLVELLI